MSASPAKPVLRFGHSPDADDAYMFFGFSTGDAAVDGYEIRHVLDEIEKLNVRAQSAELEITAVSAHGYAYVADRYAILASGASVARGYGPRVVTSSPTRPGDLAGCRIAVPGRYTTAYLLAQIFLPAFEAVIVSFDDVEGALARGEADAAILIHEGQIQIAERGHSLVMDLGQEFMEQTGLPLPLGLDVVRRDLGPELMRSTQVALRNSIEIAHRRHEDAIAYALPFGRGIDTTTADRFVRMYVNQDTLDMPPDVEEGLMRLYEMAAGRGLMPAVGALDIVR